MIEKKTNRKDKKFPISTTISQENYQLCIEKGWKFSELLIMGIQAKQEFPKVLDRLNEAELEREKLSIQMQRIAKEKYEMEIEFNKKIIELENRIKELEG